MGFSSGAEDWKMQGGGMLGAVGQMFFLSQNMQKKLIT